MKKVRLLSLALVVVLCLGMLAACSDNAGSTPTPADPTPSADVTPSGDPAGEGEIVIGLLANTTGSAAQYGLAVRNGAMLYIDQINAAGGIGGKQIRVVEYDDKGSDSDALVAYNRLVDDGITALIGCVLTGPTLAVVEETFADNMPQITASATAAAVTVIDPDDPDSDIRTNVFRSCFIDPFQGEKMAEYAKEKLGATSAAVIFETGSDYPVGLKDAFVAKCEELGIEVTAVEGYATGDIEFKAQLTKIADDMPDVIFCPNYYEDDGMIVTQARQVGITSTFLGGDGWGSVYEYASAADLEGSVYCSGYAPGANDAVVQFETDYEAAYGEKVPNMFAALAYDAALVLCDALRVAEEAGLEAGTDEYKQAVIDAMKATDGLEGITGSFRFDEFNNPIKSAAIIELVDGKEVFKELF